LAALIIFVIVVKENGGTMHDEDRPPRDGTGEFCSAVKKRAHTVGQGEPQLFGLAVKFLKATLGSDLRAGRERRDTGN
jgi:hypothetical protein